MKLMGKQMGEKRNPYRILVGKPVGKKPLGRQRCRCVDNIKMDLRKREDWVVWTGLIWLSIGASGRLVNMVMNLWVPLNVRNFFSISMTGGLPQKDQLCTVS
jgi:hypothetical protein